jgi:hypothetical protein
LRSLGAAASVDIMLRLSKTVPDHFDDAMELLDFATKRLRALTERGRIGADTAIVDMLKNAWTGLYKAHFRLKLDFGMRSFDEFNKVDYEAL